MYIMLTTTISLHENKFNNYIYNNILGGGSEGEDNIASVADLDEAFDRQ